MNTKKYLERTVKLNSSILLSDRITSIDDKTRPERFKGEISQLKIEYFEPEIVYEEDSKFSFKEKSLLKGYQNPIQRVLKYEKGSKKSDYTTIDEERFFPNYVYEYDIANNLNRIVQFHTEKPQSPFEFFSFKYNQQNQLIEKKYSCPGMGKNGWIDKYLYDSDGLLIKELWQTGMSYILFTINYDKNGNLIEKIGQVPNMKETLIKSDSPIRKVFVEPTFNSDNEIIYKMNIDYYENGKIKKIEKNNPELERFGIEESNEITFFSYDENGNTIILKSYKTHFSDNDNSKTILNNNGEIVFFEHDYYGINKWTYKYDEKLNWIYSIQYKNGEPVLIIKREFKY